MKVFMTGGTGFIGSYVAQALIGAGHTVTILARNVDKVAGFIGDPRLTLVRGTLYDEPIIREALEGKDACIHIALGWGDSATGMVAADTKPSISILETAAMVGVRKLIYTSSIAAVGDVHGRLTEESELRPIDFYGATKAATEAFAVAIGKVHGVRSNVIRPGYTFGNPVVAGASIQSDQKFHNFIRAARANRPIALREGDGTQFIWAADLAKIYLSLVESDLTRRVFTAVGTEFVTWETAARFAIELTGSSSDVVLEPAESPTPEVYYDVSAIEREFGFSFTSSEKLREHIGYLCTLPL